MTSVEWYEEEENESISETESVFDKRKKNQLLKRKWREIESIKESRRLKRELADYGIESWN